MDDAVVEMNHLTKAFPGIIALDDVTLQLRRGEIHGLLGENGAGKTTLLGLLFGLQRPSGGEICVDGKKLRFRSPRAAMAHGLGLISRQSAPAAAFSVLDSILLGAEDALLGVLKRKQARENVLALCGQYGLDIDPDAQLRDLPAGQRLLADVLKLLYRGCGILLFDEPSFGLTPQEWDEWTRFMRRLTGEGKAILFTTLKPRDILQTVDRYTVLREGRAVAQANAAGASADELACLMAGGEPPCVEKKDISVGSVVLEVRDLTVSGESRRKSAVRSVSFEVRAGEIVCVTGAPDNGQQALIAGLTGLAPLKSGRIRLSGRDISRLSVRDRARAGISHIPGSQWMNGLAPDLPLEENLSLQQYWRRAFQESGLIKKREVRKYARRLMDQYGAPADQDPSDAARSLPACHRQLAVAAREIDRGADVLIAVEPTRGLNIDDTAFIQNQLLAVRGSRRAVLLVTGDLDEAMLLADRILVMHKGEITGEADPKYTTVQELGLYMAGTLRQGEEAGFDEE